MTMRPEVLWESPCELMFSSFLENSHRPATVRWEWHPRRRRTIPVQDITSGIVVITYPRLEVCGVALGELSVDGRPRALVAARAPGVLAGQTPSPHARVFLEPQPICLGQEAATRVAAGLMTTGEAFWSSAFSVGWAEALRPGVRGALTALSGRNSMARLNLPGIKFLRLSW